MCTVTFLPLPDQGFVLTSNRDVGYQRKEALVPKSYIEKGVSLFYPKDGKAGGTWIGTSRDNRLICLLNGGFEDHKQKDFYMRSRGFIVKDLLMAQDFQIACEQIELEHIEPFTIVCVSTEHEFELSEFVWDGEERHYKNLPWQASIWSSSTLYTDDMKALRKDWFREWFIGKSMTPENILDFHRNGGLGFPEIDVFMKREKVGTVSITQVVRNGMGSAMTYFPYPSNHKGEE